MAARYLLLAAFGLVLAGTSHAQIHETPDQVRRDLVCLLAERISKVAAYGDRLFRTRDALKSNRAARVGWIAKREIIGRDRDRKTRSARARGTGSLRLRQGERFVESL